MKELLFHDAHRFEFFQLVRLLHRTFRDRQPVGGRAHPQDEVLRFGARLTLDFPASAVYELKESSPEHATGPNAMTVAFFGLTGTQGVLPYFYTEHMIARRFAGDRAMGDFFDLFNHRLVSLFFRAWEKHRPYVLYEQYLDRGQPDRYTEHLYDLIGMGTQGLRDRLPVRDVSLLFYAGLMTQHPHSASALRQILRDYFQIPVAVEQCVGTWCPLRVQDRCRMDSDGLHNQLGVGAVAGDEVWDPQARFRVRLGPLAIDRFRGFLPGGSAWKALLEWVRFFAGPALAFRVTMVLKSDDVHGCRLGDETPEAAQPGWVAWLGGDGGTGDRSDVEFDVS